MANKLSLNVGKTKYSISINLSEEITCHLLPELSISNQEIKRVSYTTFLGVLLDENLS